MPVGVPNEIVFGPFALDRLGRKLTHEGVAIPLGGRAFDVLAELAAADGGIVDKDTLMDRV